MSISSGMIERLGPVFFAHAGVVFRKLKRSSADGYWKAEAPCFGVYGEAYMLNVAPEKSVK